MYIMNKIHEICINRNLLYQTSKFNLFKRRKLHFECNKIVDELKLEDIFELSKSFLTFLNSIKDYNLEINNIEYGEGFLIVYIDGTKIDFYPKSNKFQISSNNTTFTVYKSTKISKILNEIWEPLSEQLKSRYIETILKLADKIV